MKRTPFSYAQVGVYPELQMMATGYSLSLVFASNFSLLWLYFPDCIFPHGNHLDMARSLLLSYLWGNPAGNKMHIPFQKNSHRLLLLHLIGQGWNSRLSLMITLAISLVMLWSYRQNIEWGCILPKGNLFFFIFIFPPHKKVMDADDAKQTNK